MNDKCLNYKSLILKYVLWRVVWYLDFDFHLNFGLWHLTF
jgi:hypothetical protein